MFYDKQVFHNIVVQFCFELVEVLLRLNVIQILWNKFVLKTGFITKQRVLSLNYNDKCLPENKTFV